MLANLLLARRINTQCGGALVAPWDVGQLDYTWLDLFEMLETQLPAMQKGISKIEQRKAEIRAKHPTYKH